MVQGVLWDDKSREAVSDKMIYDCFTFFNELDLLEIRLNVLAPVVDKFVIVEATRTHSGKPKSLYYETNKARYAMFADKIIHVVVDDFSEVKESSSAMEQAWARENIQRNAIIRGLEFAGAEDLVIISDLDEIPNLESARSFMACPSGVARFEQRLGCYYLNMFTCAQKTMRAGSIMMRRRTLDDARICGRPDARGDGVVSYVNEGITITKWRRYLRNERIIRNGGWHFSYLGGADVVAEKLKSIVEGGLVVDSTRLREYALARIANGEDILKRGERMVAREIDDFFPPYIRNNQQRYKDLIFPVTADYLKRVRWVPLVAWLAVCPRMIAFWLFPDCAYVAIRNVLRRWKRQGKGVTNRERLG